jgi:thymidylate synthase (FAD)
MKVRLVSYSNNPETNQSLQDIVAYCARVSNPNNQENTATNEKLIKYLVDHKHWSPLEMVSVCLEIETTRDIARQILRHRSFSFQEFSQRYAKAELGFECRESRLQDVKNRQNSFENTDKELDKEWTTRQNELVKHSQKVYNWALDHGIAKEQARCVLPEGMTMTRMYMNGTLRSWIHYIQLRSGNGTQKEHADIAIECSKVIQSIFPLAASFI